MKPVCIGIKVTVCIPCADLGDVMKDSTKRQIKYDAANTRRIYLKLNVGTDRDILEKLDSVPNRQGYIKSLIRKDITGK